jgi:hypothetical protein
MNAEKRAPQNIFKGLLVCGLCAKTEAIALGSGYNT